MENNLISENQTGFNTNQLPLITHDIYKSFGIGSELRGIFLDISKALDKIWHK